MKSKRKDIPTFLLNINYVGIGRFILSCKADAGYIEEDTRYFINEFIKKHTEKTNAAFEFNILTLTKEQTAQPLRFNSSRRKALLPCRQLPQIPP